MLYKKQSNFLVRKMSSELMYREHIMDHFKNPRNYGHLTNASFKHKEFNPLCGDEITVEVKLNKDIIQDISFVGRGCSISQASASMFTEEIKGKTIQEVKLLDRNFVLGLLNIEITPVRLKCALLALFAVKEGIKQWEGGK